MVLKEKKDKKILKNFNVIIPIAGKGSRSGLSYPKTLFLINKKPILIHILDKLENYSSHITLIVNPKTKKLIENSLRIYKKKVEIIFQKQPLGMGNAVLQYKNSNNYNINSKTLLIWGDIPFIQKTTLNKMIKQHFDNSNDLTFVSAITDRAYTKVIRDEKKKVVKVIETREEGSKISTGERDIGLFIFNTDTIMKYLSKKNLRDKLGKITQEHGFLYIIYHLVKDGHKVECLPIAKDKDLISFNKFDDIIKYIK